MRRQRADGMIEIDRNEKRVISERMNGRRKEIRVKELLLLLLLE